GEEGTQTYVLFPVLSDESTNPKNNNKDGHADGKEHDDDIQKFVSPDIHFSSCGDQTREQECINNSSNGVSAAGPSVSADGLDFTNSTNDFSAAGPSVSDAELNFTNSTNDFKNQTNSNAGFQDTEKAGDEGTQTYVLFPVLSDGYTNLKNNKDALVDGKEHDDDIQKSVSLDIYSSSYGDQTREQECFNNNSNEVNAAGSSVFAVGLNFTNSTNDFSAVGPSNAAMSNLEDLSHNADDVGAEADINNMESIISVSPILTSRIHKDHLTSQIIGDLSSTTQTRSMTRRVRDQGGISQMFNEDFHTCMFACFLSQEEPKRVHQALKDPKYIPTVRISVLTADVYISKKFFTVEEFALLHEDNIYSESRRYLQHENYAIWEVIKFGDSYKAPPEETAKDKGLAGEVSSSTKKKGKTVAITAEDMQLQAIVSHLEFMDVPIEQDNLNQTFLTSLAIAWLVYTIVWRNIDDLDTMSLDDVYNHLKVYEPKRESYKKDPKVEEPAPKAMIAIDGIGWDWSYIAEEDKASKNHALVANEEEKDLSWMGLPGFVNDTVTDYTRRTPSIDGTPHDNIDDKGYWDIGCSRHMTGNISYLSEYEPFNGGYVSFGHGRGNIIDFKLVDDKHVLLRTPRQQNMYTIGLKNIVPHKNLTCLIAKALVDESMLWHRRLGHLNFKTMNKLVRSNLVKGLPSKSFENDHSCVACMKGKQHKASCKSKLVNSVSKPLHTLHMDLFGPTSVSSLNHKWNCLVVTDDFSRFTWTFFLKSKDETSRILRNFITEIENLKDLNVKIIKSDNGGEFRNKEMDKFCSRKGIKREFSNARTLQQNGVAQRRNKALIEAAKTMLGKFDAKGDKGYFVGYSLSSKAFGVFNKRTKKIEENLHVNFLENKSIEKELEHLLLTFQAQMATSNETAKNDDVIPINNAPQEEQQEFNRDKELNTHVPIDSLFVPPVTSSVPRIISNGGSSFPEPLSLGNAMSFENRLEDFFGDTSNAVSLNEVEADLSNMETAIQVSPTFTLRINKDHPKSQIISPVDTPVQTKQKTKNVNEQSFIAIIHQKTNYDLLQYCLFSLYQMDVKSAFPFGTIDEEVYVMQPPGFQDLEFPHRVYKVEKAMYGLHQALRAWYDDNIFGSSNPKLCREFKALMHDKFQMSAMGELNFFLGLQVLQKKDGIFLSQDKYVGDILKKFGHTDIRAAKTPMDRENPRGNDGTGKDMELQVYRFMIGSLMYLTASRPDIMFDVCACARHQVIPKECHLHAVKRIFRYLKGNPKLGLWYPKESSFDLVEYSDTDYGGGNQDRKSTTEGFQFFGRRLISLQCKKQTIVATSTTEVEYVAAASGYGQVLWIQN
nr:uncharacterized mitochondrial protein AtMg00810-like [Tanacetum cinerariifolium]